MSNVTMWEIENSFYSDEIQVICGVDEAGRGPLAGPVCAAAVILPENCEIEGLKGCAVFKHCFIYCTG